MALWYHKQVGQRVIIVLIGVHIVAVLYYLWRRKRDLIGPMWHGDKPLRDPTLAADDSWAMRLRALGLMGLCAGLVAAVVAMGNT